MFIKGYESKKLQENLKSDRTMAEGIPTVGKVSRKKDFFSPFKT